MSVCVKLFFFLLKALEINDLIELYVFLSFESWFQESCVYTQISSIHFLTKPVHLYLFIIYFFFSVQATCTTYSYIKYQYIFEGYIL